MRGLGVCIFNNYGSKKLGGCSLVLVLTHSFMLAGKLCNAVACVFWGARIALVRAPDSWLKGLNPCRSSRRIFFSRVNFLFWLLFWYPFHPFVTAVACKRSWSFYQKCRWQVTAKHTCTLRMWLCIKWHDARLYGVHRTCAETAAVSCGTSHASAVSTPLRWRLKTRYKKLDTRVESHVSAREQRTALYKSNLPSPLLCSGVGTSLV